MDKQANVNSVFEKIDKIFNLDPKLKSTIKRQKEQLKQEYLPYEIRIKKGKNKNTINVIFKYKSEKFQRYNLEQIGASFEDIIHGSYLKKCKYDINKRINDYIFYRYAQAIIDLSKQGVSSVSAEVPFIKNMEVDSYEESESDKKFKGIQITLKKIKLKPEYINAEDNIIKDKILQSMRSNIEQSVNLNVGQKFNSNSYFKIIDSVIDAANNELKGIKIGGYPGRFDIKFNVLADYNSFKIDLSVVYKQELRDFDNLYLRNETLWKNIKEKMKQQRLRSPNIEDLMFNFDIDPYYNSEIEFSVYATFNTEPDKVFETLRKINKDIIPKSLKFLDKILYPEKFLLKQGKQAENTL